MARALAEVCGADVVRDGIAASRLPVAGVAPEVVIAPRDEQSLAAALARCSEEGWVVEPAGRCTWLFAGRRPRRVDVLVTTMHLSEVTPAAAADGVVTAGAGAAFGELSDVVRDAGQQVPLDAPGEWDASIGATFATASAGPLRLGYGTPRDHALGLNVATGDGRVLSFGGTVVKNVAGYDIVRLLVGSRGSLGVITRLHVRLQPLPADDATVLLPVPAAAVAELVHALMPFGPVALELVSPELFRRVSGRDGWAVAARFHGVNEAVDEAVAATVAHGERLSSSAPGDRDDAADTGTLDGRLGAREAATLWDRLRSVEARAMLHARFAALPATLDATLAAAMRLAETGGQAAGWCVAAHAGEGIVRAWLTGSPELHPLVDIAHAVERSRGEIESRGGSLIVPVAPAEMPDDFDPFGRAGVDDAILRVEAGLRSAFDPAGILAPGRFTRAGAAPEVAHV